MKPNQKKVAEESTATIEKMANEIKLNEEASLREHCPNCKMDYTQAEILTNEHCFNCGEEIKT